MLRQIFISFLLSFGALISMYLLYVALPQYLVMNFGPSTSPYIKTQFAQILIDPTPLPTPQPTPLLTPVTIIIPKLGIQTAIESVGLTTTNNMDVPKNAASVAWYMHGPRPSEEGNAVIAGHFDTPSGRPAVFYHLKTLEVGDEIEVVSQNGVRSTFIVSDKSTIPVDTFPEDFVFKTKPGRNLNLITCGGIWDAKRKLYTDRIVVYAVFKESHI